MEGDTEVRTIFADPTDPTIIIAPVYGAQATITSVARMLRDLPGVGQPYFALTAIPGAIDANPGADLTNAPLVSNNIADNEAAIQQMLADTDLQALPNDRVFVAS